MIFSPFSPFSPFQSSREELVFGPEVATYEARYNSFGETLSVAGKRSIQDALDLVQVSGASLSRGYLFGSTVNLPAAHGRVLNFGGGGTAAEFVKDAGADSHLFTPPGLMVLEGDTLGQGYLESGEAMFDNTDWTILIYADRSLTNTLLPGSGSYTPTLISQYTSTAAGNFVVGSGSTGGVTINALGGSVVAIQEAGVSKNEPIATWMSYVAATKTWTFHNAFTGVLLGTSTQSAAINTGTLTRLGQHARTASQGAPRSLKYGGLFKFAGILTELQRQTIFAGLHPIVLRHCHMIWSPGNSVTSNSNALQSGDAISAVGTAAAWPHIFSRWASKNNAWYLRFAGLSSRNMYSFRPASWLDNTNVAARITLPAREAAISADAAAPFLPNIMLNDEQQNTAGLTVTYADFSNVRAQIFAVATAGAVRATKLVQPTQMGVMNTNYAAALSDGKSNRLRDFSALIRTDPAVDAVAELYGAFNRGWDTGVDGNAANSLTDLPNGDPIYFRWESSPGVAAGDSIHPNTLGHATMASLYQAAVATVLD